jgi:predicted nuclease with TOPRIM domain
MLIRISLIVAIVTGLAVGVLNFVKVKEIITTTRAERDEWHGKFDTTDRQLTETKKDLKQTTTELTQTQETLKTTTAEKDKAIASANAQTKRANDLTEKLGTTTKERDDARAEVAAYHVTGFDPQQVAELSKTLKQAQASVTESQAVIKGLQKEKGKLETRLRKYELPDAIVYLPQKLKGQVMVSDPKWDFVVLNIGEDQQVVEDGELLVNRNGKLVAKVKVTTVQKDRCIANVVPGWKLGEILEGDQVIPAHPAS